MVRRWRRILALDGTGIVLLTLVGVSHPATAGVDVWTSGDQPGGEIHAAALAGEVCYAAGPSGLFRSTDGCATWSRIPALAGVSVSEVAIDVAQPTTAYAATSGGMWRTLDAGADWAEIGEIGTGSGVRGTPFAAVAVDPTISGQAWFVEGGHVWRTTTSGDGIWGDVTSNLASVQGVVFDASTGWLWSWASGPYIAVQQSPGGMWVEGDSNLSPTFYPVRIVVDRAAGRLIFADDAGVASLPSMSGPGWIPLGAGLPSGVYAVDLAVDHANTAYLVDVRRNVFRLPTAETTWVRADGGLPGQVATHIAADRTTSGHLLAGTAGGSFGPIGGQGPLWRSSDGGMTWMASATGFDAVHVNTLVADPSHRGGLLAGTQNDGVQRSADGGATWAPSSGIAGPTYVLAIDPTRPGVALAALSSAGLWRSVDGGASWNPIAAPPAGAIDQLVFDSSGRAVAATGLGHVAASNDGGVTWGDLPMAGLPMFLFQYDLALDPLHAGDVWLATVNGPLVLAAGATSWSARTTGLTTLVVTSLAFDAHRAGRVYAATSGAGIWRSDDGGGQWQRASNGIADSSPAQVVADVRVTGVAYAATYLGVYRTADAGETWTAMPAPGGGINRLATDADGHTIYGATDGMGVLALSQSAAPTIEAPPTISGKTRARKMLHGDPGGWDAVPAPDFAFQWIRCNRRGKHCRLIKKATHADLRLRGADVGHRLELGVTASNARGTATATSLPTPVVKRAH